MTRRVLTDPLLRSLKAAPAGKRYAVADALVPGLAVRVTAKGHKSFILWRRIGKGKSSAVALALGEVGTLTLAGAREKARSWIELIKQGRDPRELERDRDSLTFGAVIEEYLTRHVKGQRRARGVESEIRKDLIPGLASKPLAEITRRDVTKLVEAIKDRGAPYQAHNVLGHAKTFFNWAIERGIYGIETSPCDRIKPARLIGAKLARQRVLNDDELRAFWRATDALGYPMGAVYRLLLLTGARKDEVARAKWSEFDLDAGVWTVPPERYKSGASHLVPLSDAAQALIGELPRWRGGHYLFSTDGKKPVNGFSKAKARVDALMLRELGRLEPFVNHDLRRTVRTRLSSLRIPDPVAEMVIGHGRKGLQRVYDQHSYLDEMREALTAWAVRLRSIVDPPPPNVVPMERVS